MKETQKTITRWADDTFGWAHTIESMAVRANEEMAELLKAVVVHGCNGVPVEKTASEVADVFIVLYRLADYLGVDIHKVIDEKMVKNRARLWKRDGMGHGCHIAKIVDLTESSPTEVGADHE